MMFHVRSVLPSVAVAMMMVSSASAAFWNEETLSRSSWNSVYTAPDGTLVPALLRFNGTEGTYDVQGGRGELFDIQYGVDTDSNPGKPFFQITGQWSYAGSSGRFTFSSNGRDRFQGSWQGDIGQGKWSGTAMYGAWKKDDKKNRMYCEYRYPDKEDPEQINTQTMIWYPEDPKRSKYYYFANKENKIWGRCVCPKSDDYDANVMQWSRLNGNNEWDELPQGDCPAPKDGDPQNAAIDRIPDPPA